MLVPRKASLLLPAQTMCKYLCFNIFLGLMALFRVKVSKDNFAAEFKAHRDCLDYNDYRAHECRDTEKKFFACWNKLNGVPGF